MVTHIPNLNSPANLLLFVVTNIHGPLNAFQMPWKFTAMVAKTWS